MMAVRGEGIQECLLGCRKDCLILKAMGQFHTQQGRGELLFIFWERMVLKMVPAHYFFWTRSLIIGPEITSSSALPLGWHSRRHNSTHSEDGWEWRSAPLCPAWKHSAELCNAEFPRGKVTHLWTSGTPGGTWGFWVFQVLLLLPRYLLDVDSLFPLKLLYFICICLNKMWIS